MRRPRPWCSDDGSSLVIVLIIVTVLAVVSGVVLSQLDTSERATLALRDQAGAVYNGDSAAQVAITQLVNDNFNGAAKECVTTDAVLPLPKFYPPVNGLSANAPSSAYVTCTHDPDNNPGGATLPNTSPGNALLTLDPTLSEVGIYANVNAGPVKVRGSVFSNSAIRAPGGLMNTWTPPAGATTTTYNLAAGACTPTTDRATRGVWVQNLTAGTTTCDYATADPRGQDPGTLNPHGASYDTPPAPTKDATINACKPGDKYQTVTPGRFAGAAAQTALNGLTGCGNGVVWFTPGTYYFDLPGTWNVPSLYLIGGTVNPAIDLTKKPNTFGDFTRACVAPDPAHPTASTPGVEFVLGGTTQLAVNNSANPGTQMTICASNSPSGPPIAIYGLKTALGGGFPVTAESPCTPSGFGSTSCAVITTGNSPKSTLTIQGTTYLPRGVIDVTLNNNTKKIFYWGLISWATEFTGTGSADVSNALVDVPDAAPSPTPASQVVYLTVYVCPGSNTCSASGPARVRVKVKLAGSAPRTATVLSWSNQG